MRIPLLCAVLVLATAACDRREDTVEPAGTDAMSAPADRTATTPEAAGDPYPAAADPSMPPAEGTNPTGTTPTGTDPAMPVTCAENDPNCVDTVPDPAREPATTPTPTQPPTQ